MDAAPELRAMCFNIAATALESCGDRIALGLNDMELCRINHDAQHGVHTNDALFDMAEGFFKLQLLDQIATEKIASCIDRRMRIDEIEIRLAYQTELVDRLHLPGVGSAMLYRGWRKSGRLLP